MDTLLAGSAAVDITPERPQWLDGYGNRTAPSEGAYQSIRASGLALAQKDATSAGFLLVCAEVLCFDRERTEPLKRRISLATGVPFEAIVLSASHTHCAPRVCDMVMPGVVDAEYVSWFEARCVEAAERACADLTAVRASVSRAHDKLGVNRRFPVGDGVVSRSNPNGTRDADVDTLWLRRLDGSLHTSWTIASTHPTSRGGPLIGGDYPGFLTRRIEDELGGRALFSLGCAGDVRPNFTRDGSAFRMADLEEVEAAGNEMAREVLASAAEARKIRLDRVRSGRCEVSAMLADEPSVEEFGLIQETDSNPLKREWARRMLEEGRHPNTVPHEIQVLALDPGLVCLFWSGEVVSDYALWFKEQTNGAPYHAMVGAYCNAAMGYVPSRSIYPRGGYEVNGSHFYYRLPAPYAPVVEEQIRTATLTLLQETMPWTREHS